MNIIKKYFKWLWLGFKSLVDYFALSISVTIIFSPLMLLERFYEKFGKIVIPLALFYIIFIGTPLLGAYLPPLLKITKEKSGKNQ